MRASRAKPAAVLGLALLLAAVGACGGNTALEGEDAGGRGGLSLSRAEVLADLDGMPCPPGVEAADFAALKETLRSALLARDVERFTTAAPESASSAVNDFAIEPLGEGVILTWTYLNTGDYNQDKLVAVNDLTPVGVHLGVGEGDAGWDEARIADGDANGLVTVSDITPIGQNYLIRVEGYRLQVSTDNQASWQSAATYLFEESQLLAGRRYFNVEFSSVVNGGYYRVVPYDGDHNGIPSNVKLYELVGGEAPEIISVAPTAGQAGTEVTISAVVSGDEPLSYTWDFGGGAAPGTSQEAEPTVTLGVTGDYSAELIVTNLVGTDNFPFTLTIYAEDNEPPVIDDVAYDGATRTMTVTVSDPDAGDTITVSVEESANLLVDQTAKAAQGTGPYTAEFYWTPSSLTLGADEFVTVTAEDSLGATDLSGTNVVIPGVTLAADTLYAVPERGGASAGEEVLIYVITGVPANPFHYMNLVSVTVETGAEYVPNSFNSGEVGGGSSEVDGYWQLMDPEPVSMLSPPDVYITDEDIGGGRERWEFPLAPLGTDDETAAEGLLFNFRFTFGTPGTYTLGFQQETGEVKRTYYSDQAENEYFWADISNSHDGFANRIVVY